MAQKELLRGQTKSCGCLRREKRTAANKFGKVDRELLNPNEKIAYAKWRSMLSRTNNPKGKSKHYEKVTVCDRWKDFYCFLQDMGEPRRGHSLDRIDNTKGYEPENCRWVPLAHQNKNTSRNRVVTYKGRSKILSDHARDVGLNPDLVFDRVNKLKWPVERALATPRLRTRAASPLSLTKTT